MEDYLTLETEKAAFEILNELSPELLKHLRTLLHSGISTEQILKRIAKKFHRTADSLGLIGCACDYLDKQEKVAVLNSHKVLKITKLYLIRRVRAILTEQNCQVRHKSKVTIRKENAGRKITA